MKIAVYITEEYEVINGIQYEEIFNETCDRLAESEEVRAEFAKGFRYIPKDWEEDYETIYWNHILCLTEEELKRKYHKAYVEVPGRGV